VTSSVWRFQSQTPSRAPSMASFQRSLLIASASFARFCSVTSLP
jgi:hypothetical protein